MSNTLQSRLEDAASVLDDNDAPACAEAVREAMAALNDAALNVQWSDKALKKIIAYCTREEADGAEKENTVCPRTSAYGGGRRLVASMVIPMARRGLPA